MEGIDTTQQPEAMQLASKVSSISLAHATTTGDGTPESTGVLLQRLQRELCAQRAEILLLRDTFVDVLEAEELHRRLHPPAAADRAEGGADACALSPAERTRIRTCKKQLWNQLIHITKQRRHMAAARQRQHQQQQQQQHAGTATSSSTSAPTSQTPVISRPLTGPYVSTKASD
eukprot:TRINITY_DN201_c2_g1_i1.p1 TRINITY_DN201_c2_g1~~TRINITY_DN201_c2_g1_i1.p1  ORF type:complete len:200 (+),score=49.79 TRINITY_DN201_c2_g1_i1:80-601(+)